MPTLQELLNNPDATPPEPEMAPAMDMLGVGALQQMLELFLAHARTFAPGAVVVSLGDMLDGDNEDGPMEAMQPEGPPEALASPDSYSAPSLPTALAEPVTPPPQGGAGPQGFPAALTQAKQNDFYQQRDLQRAFDPLSQQLGGNIDTLSRFGYSKPVTDPYGYNMKATLRNVVANLK